MIFFLYNIFIQCQLNKDLLVHDKFSLFINHNKQFTLTKANIINASENKKKILNDQPCWYYVHFLINDISPIRKFIIINRENIIMQNTFLLFLNKYQVEIISNISLIKKIEPNEKYYEDAGSIIKNDLLIIKTTNNFAMPAYDNEYTIKQMQDDSIFILNLNGKTESQKIKIINYLCNIPEVQTVSTYKYPKLANSLMTAYTQFNNKNFKRYQNSQYYYLDRYLNSRGITGENEIITIIDSPIDFNHAFFRDDNMQVEFNKHIPKHRKIVYYTYDGNMTKWENEISEYEHGTHVAGTAAGKSICSNDDVSKTSMFNGNAPDAKIAYGGSNTFVDLFKLNNLFDEINSKISSNSWGNDYYSNQMNFNFGSLALINPNVTFIFAAGNFYENLGNFSIRDPQGSKNILTVGALGDFYSDKVSTYVITSIKNPELSFVANDVSFKDIMINATIGNVPGKTDIYAFESTDKKCGNLLNNNKFLIYGGGDISWINDCEYNENPNFLFTDDKTTIKKILDSKSEISISKNFKVDKNKTLLRINYSSTGPASKGILKPDLMAPGSKIISTKSRSKSSNPHGCGNSKDAEFIFMNGTSMAAPNIAGAAALIRQYFNSGKWINKVILDGETTRALLINSCKHPLDSKTPDIMYGHGVVDLSTVIPIEGDFGVQITPQRTDINTSSVKLLDEIHQKPSVTKNGHVVAKLEVNTNIKSTKLQITLSYLDTMINMDSPIPLVRDLDLIVTSPSNKIYYGDHLVNKDTQHLSTNEKIIIDENELENGIYTIHVYGGNFIDSIFPELPEEQEFSVVASGPIANGTIIFSNSTECPCNKCNQNMPGYCICEKNTQIGQACQIDIETINGNTSSFTLKPLEIKRVMFNSNKIVKKIYSTSDNPGHESTIWASKNCHLTLNEYEINGYTTNTHESNSGTDINFGSKNLCVSIFNNNDRDATYKIEVSDGYIPTPTPKPTSKPDPTSKHTPTAKPDPTNEPTPTGAKCEKDVGSSGSSSKEKCKERESSKILGDFKIKTIYLGASSIVKFKPGYSIMRTARKIFGQIIPPPNFIHSAIWVSSETNINDETLGAIVVYGKYYTKGHDDSYLFDDGARSFVMTFGEFKEQFNSFDVKKLIPQKDVHMFNFIKEIKDSGKWNAFNYNWPTNNCQHFTTLCLNILKAIRYSPNENDWADLPYSIMKTLKTNEIK